MVTGRPCADTGRKPLGYGRVVNRPEKLYSGPNTRSLGIGAAVGNTFTPRGSAPIRE